MHLSLTPAGEIQSHIELKLNIKQYLSNILSPKYRGVSDDHHAGAQCAKHLAHRNSGLKKSILTFCSALKTDDFLFACLDASF